ncbi:small multidrug resistance pump [Albimonas donghaensis]|uniref:Small multidrug resistance pump n=1 Tax=Albimonas donghaensis TaxID=356660 RepID=A0A1H2YQI0_9RHOB|nr:SMR family transporter [Albimonas donghaensis]MAS41984.1 QacE family quaternary ammonium compound efflux SMR transporter [Paracoccaceae bacterium]MBR25717.1 QacE family quaternary ammonium compound efflux SMR transporter [Paracoccaceae bacterium]SDX07503.1 small multidrug resistance pump [Albimonas donghaensis]|tara:strand:- start:409 stop:741 length:333 start_codon:yes stop_codon:yes gene_type:complete
MIVWIYLIVAVVGEVIGTTALKSSEGFTRLGPSVVVVGGYAVAFFFLSLTLRHMPVGVAYAMWSGVGTVLITLIGWVIFSQKLDLAAIAGIGLIVAGVVVLQLFSDTSPH